MVMATLLVGLLGAAATATPPLTSSSSWQTILGGPTLVTSGTIWRGLHRRLTSWQPKESVSPASTVPPRVRRGGPPFLPDGIPNAYGVVQKGAIKATQRKGIDTDFSLVSDELKTVGYNTAIVGKWHVGCAAWEQTPTRRGFDTYYGFMCNGDLDFREKTAELYYDMWNNTSPEKEQSKLSYDVRTSTLYDAAAVRFIRAQSTATPWFLYYALQDPHTPLSAPWQLTSTEPCASLRGDHARQIYCGMIRCIDSTVETVMQAVSASGFSKNTLVVFSGDNGGAPGNGGYNYPLRGSKGTLYEGGIRQASWAWGSMLGANVRGTTYHGQIHLADLYPTFMSAGTNGRWTAPSGTALDGIDVWNAISTGIASPRTETLLNCVDAAGGIRVGDFKLLVGQGDAGWYAHPTPSAATDPAAAAVEATTRTSAYVAQIFPLWSNNATQQQQQQQQQYRRRSQPQSAEAEVQLFNVVADPCEYTDLAATHATLVAELRAKFRAYTTQAADYNADTEQEEAAENNAGRSGYWGPWLGETLPARAAGGDTAEQHSLQQ